MSTVKLTLVMPEYLSARATLLNCGSAFFTNSGELTLRITRREMRCQVLLPIDRSEGSHLREFVNENGVQRLGIVAAG